MELSLARRTIGGIEVLAADGEIDLATIPRFRDSVLRIVADRPGETVAVDLDGVLVLDDTGLGVLMAAAGRARQAGGELVVVCQGERLRQQLEATHFDRAVRVTSAVHDIASG